MRRRRQQLQVAEWSRLNLPVELDTPRFRERLIAAGETPLGSTFRSAGHRIYACDLVGILSVGRAQIQIVPKIYDAPSNNRNAALLLRMFLRAGIPIKPYVAPARMAESDEAVSEHIIRLVADDLYRKLARGVPRRYAERSQWSETIRGRIDLGRLARRRPAENPQLPVRYAPLQYDNPITRLLRALISRVSNATQSARTINVLRRSDELLRVARRVPLTLALSESVRLSRFEAEWTDLVLLAKLLAQEGPPDTVSAGELPGFGLLFPLDYLFEGIIRRSLTRAVAGTSYAVGRPVGSRLLKSRARGDEFLEIRPDLLLRRLADQSPVLVGDAKWKRLASAGPNLAVQRSDVYQILSYMYRLDLPSAVLFFPAQEPIANTGGIVRHDFDFQPEGKRLRIIEVDPLAILSDDEGTARAAEQAMARECISFIDPTLDTIRSNHIES